ncbi:MAG: hotdog fold thioesterase [Alicyclobacillus sp.]|nr:hotdog fold thioesterase [Alicyclobacillus sp.]
MTQNNRIEQIKEMARGTLMEQLGMEILRFDPECVEISMPVERRTQQPFGLLHGGASVALAESAASLATWLNIDPETQAAVGMEINANHVRPKRDGVVTATATPLHRGRTTMVWDIRIRDEKGRLVSVSRCTVAVVHRRDRLTTGG